MRTYRAVRYDVVWTSRKTVANYRYPTPFPIHNQSWSVELDGQAIVLGVPIEGPYLP